MTELCRQLQVPLTDNVSQLMDRYAEQQRTQGGAFRGPGRRRSSSGRRELLAAIETQWPELADANEWSKSELLTNDDADKLLKSIQELPEYAVGNPSSTKHEIAKSCSRIAEKIVSLKFQGNGLGAQLILAAGRRCLLAATEVGGVAILIDAKSERAAKWYASFGAVALPDTPLSLLLPLATIQAAWRPACDDSLFPSRLAAPCDRMCGLQIKVGPVLLNPVGRVVGHGT